MGLSVVVVVAATAMAMLPEPSSTLMKPSPPQENGTVKKAIAQMIQSLLLSLAARSQLQELREKLRSPVVDKGPILKAKPPAAQKDILGVCSDPLVLAQQLTHVELVSAPACSVACIGWGWAALALLSHWVLQGYLPAGPSGL